MRFWYDSARPTITWSASSKIRCQAWGSAESKTIERKKTKASRVSFRDTPRSAISVPYSPPSMCDSDMASWRRRRMAGS